MPNTLPARRTDAIALARPRNAAAVSVLLLLAAAFSQPAPAHAEDAAPDFFVIGPQQVGFAMAYGNGVEFAGSGLFEAHEIREIVLMPHWQIAFTREPIEPAWYKGRVGFRAEPTLGLAFEPHGGVYFGLTLFFRYDFVGWGRFSPYIQAGAGPLGLWLDVADQADGLAFDPQGGVGVNIRLDPRWSLDVGCRFVHISNAYTHSPNGGFDSMHVTLGLARHF